MIRKVDRLSCVRFGSARYSVPTRHIGARSSARRGRRTLTSSRSLWAPSSPSTLVAPGETSIIDDHYGGPRPTPGRAVRPKTTAEIAFCALGPAAETFIKAAAAAGNSARAGPRRARRHGSAHGASLIAALERAVTFGRHRAERRPLDPRRRHRRAQPAPGEALVIPLPAVATRPLSDYAIGASTARDARRELDMTAPPGTGRRSRSRAAPAAARRHAPPRPRAARTAKTQRWSPEEFLRTLIEAEIASRDASNARDRLKAAAFPVTKTIDEFDLAASSIPAATFDYLASLEWIAAPRTSASSARPGPARATCSSPSATPPSTPGTGSATSPPPSSSRPSTAAWPTTASAGSSKLLRHDLILRRDRVRPARRHRRPTVLPSRRRRLRTTLPRHRLALAVRGLGPVHARTHHRRQPPRPAPPPRRRRRHRRRVLPHARSPNPTTRRRQNQLNNPRGGDFYLATTGDCNLAVDKALRQLPTARARVS